MCRCLLEGNGGVNERRGVDGDALKQEDILGPTCKNLPAGEHFHYASGRLPLIMSLLNLLYQLRLLIIT
jgi:hypothetical protein